MYAASALTLLLSLVSLAAGSGVRRARSPDSAMRVSRIGWLLVALPLAAGAQTPLCDGPAPPLAPSRDLYCIELIAAPGIEGASGRVELGRIPGPFAIAVAA